MRHLVGLIYLVVYSLTSMAQAVDNFNLLDNTQATISGGSISGISPPIPVASGGTGAATLTGIVKGNGTSAMTAVTAPTGALVGTTDTQSLSGKTFDTLSASSTTAGILVNRTSGNTVNSKLQYGGTDYIGYGYDGTDNFLWGYSANDVKLGARGSERLRLTATSTEAASKFSITGATSQTETTGNSFSITTAGANNVNIQFGGSESSGYTWQRTIQSNVGAIPHRFYIYNTKIFELSSTGASVTGTLTVSSGGSANKAICWKSGNTLGYCSSSVGADGSCTCN